LQPATSGSQLLHNHILEPIVGYQMGEGLSVISGVEASCLHLQRHALFALYGSAYAITTRSYGISHGRILDPIAGNRASLQSFREIDGQGPSAAR
jgi:hypothetical protein